MVIFCIKSLFHESSEQINERHILPSTLSIYFHWCLLLFGFLSFAISCFIVKVYDHVSCFTFYFLPFLLFSCPVY